jgi:Starch-binding associating with outer membrane
MKRFLTNAYPLLTFAVWAGIAFTSCDNYVGGDVNKNPSRVSEDQVLLSTLLPTVLFNTGEAHFALGFTVSQWTQQTANYGAGGTDSQDPVALDGAWSTIYLNSLQVATRMVTLAQQRNSPAYVGIGKAMQALNLGLLTDNFEAVPWKQALTGSANLTPDYDSQETIYSEINRLLNEAGAELQKPASASLFVPSATEDIVYAGNLTKWLRLTTALKARYAIHLSAKNPVTAANNARQALMGMGMTSIDDDFLLNYNTRNLNPWSTNVALANNTGNYTLMWSDYTVKLLADDPRLTLIARPIKVVAPLAPSAIIGLPNGTAPILSGSQAPNAHLNEYTFFGTTTAPILMFTYAEQKFIEAEAGFFAGGGTATSSGTPEAVRTAVVEGIRANMLRMKVADTAITRYVSRIPAASALRLQDIMTEKYKAQLLNPETWVDMRRYAFDPNILRNLAYPQNGNVDAAGRWVQRSEYPGTERARNSAKVQPFVKFFTVPMWRDTK